MNYISSSVLKTEMVGEGILMNKVWHSDVTEFGFVSSNILQFKFKFSRNKICDKL